MAPRIWDHVCLSGGLRERHRRKATIFRALPRGLVPKVKSFNIDDLAWLGRQDSNLGMAVPKTAALPLGYAPPRWRSSCTTVAALLLLFQALCRTWTGQAGLKPRRSGRLGCKTSRGRLMMDWLAWCKARPYGDRRLMRMGRPCPAGVLGFVARSGLVPTCAWFGALRARNWQYQGGPASAGRQKPPQSGMARMRRPRSRDLPLHGRPHGDGCQGHGRNPACPVRITNLTTRPRRVSPRRSACPAHRHRGAAVPSGPWSECPPDHGSGPGEATACRRNLDGHGP